MQEKELTIDEIIKGLDNLSCYHDEKGVHEFLRGAIALIQDQKQEIELFSKVISSSKRKTKVLELRKEIERLTWTSNLQRDGTRLYERRCEELQKQVEKLEEENEYLDMVAKQALTDCEKLQVQVDELTDELKKAYEIERANIQAEIADAGTSCHWCERQTVKEIFDKIFEVLCCFTTQGKSKEYNEGYIDCLAEVDKRLQNLAKERGVEVE